MYLSGIFLALYGATDRFHVLAGRVRVVVNVVL